MSSNRTLIADFLVTHLKKINGDVSTFDPSYTYHTNLHENVFRGMKYIDEINDFPCIYAISGLEERFYNTKEFTEARIETVLRCYLHGDNTKLITNNLVQDVEHIIYNLPTQNELNLQDITIKEVIIDSGLFKPYGMAEIFLNTRLEIFNF